MARVLGLRTVDKKHRSYGGFKWPSSGKVVAPDWIATPRCGNGLHALIGGIGNGRLLMLDEGAIWQAVWIDEAKIIDLDGKAKFPECKIACEGTREEVIRFMVKHGADATKMVGGIVIGDKVAVANGTFGQATANGEKGKATANGERGQATAGGYQGKAKANGKYGIAMSNGYKGLATANGYQGIAVASGREGQAIANGEGGKATAGHNGCAVANGDGGRAYSGGTASAGPNGTITIYGTIYGTTYTVVGHVGKDNIQPCILYKVDDGCKFIPATLPEKQ